jgi:hypothetical protein
VHTKTHQKRASTMQAERIQPDDEYSTDSMW